MFLLTCLSAGQNRVSKNHPIAKVRKQQDELPDKKLVVMSATQRLRQGEHKFKAQGQFRQLSETLCQVKRRLRIQLIHIALGFQDLGLILSIQKRIIGRNALSGCFVGKLI